jgi:hypothetical protein
MQNLTDSEGDFERAVDLAKAIFAKGQTPLHSQVIPFRKSTPASKPVRPAPAQQPLRPAAETLGSLLAAAVSLHESDGKLD